MQVLETAGANYWAAEFVSKGQRRNISNGLSIRVPSHTHPRIQVLELKHATALTKPLNQSALPHSPAHPGELKHATALTKPTNT